MNNAILNRSNNSISFIIKQIYEANSLLANYPEDTTLPSFSNARRAKKYSLLFSRLCAEARGLRGTGSGVKNFVLMYFDGLNLFGIMEDALVLTRQMRLLVGNQCFVLIILIA